MENLLFRSKFLCTFSVSSPHPVGPGLSAVKPQPVFIANYGKDLGAGEAIVASALITENAQDVHHYS